ncbi:hypothetical protein, partial [Pseudomonas sp. GM16]|uniref:hypothetical protein n=1 Tax=Pseudomonas sp. GM16 TaxID=1144322 RepID=UPI0005EBF2AA
RQPQHPKQRIFTQNPKSMVGPKAAKPKAISSQNHKKKTNPRQIFYIFSFMICRADTSCLKSAKKPFPIRL